MAFSSGSGQGGPQTDINVTPLVDVVLVLLIIFMVVVPLLQVNLEADIPKPPDETVPPPPDDQQQVVIQVKRDGTYINTERIADDAALAARLEVLMKARKKDDKIAFVTGEETLAFEKVIHVMDIARGAGVEKVGIIDPL